MMFMYVDFSDLGSLPDEQFKVSRRRSGELDLDT